MSQPNSYGSRTSTPGKHYPATITKGQILSWIHALFPSVEKSITIESLGNGALYCKLINHYLPNAILPSRIISAPVNEYESCLNLKQLQLALTKAKINIPFDLNKVSKQRFHQNWNLVVLLFKHFDGGDFKKVTEERVPMTPRRAHFQLPVCQKEPVLEESKKTNELHFNNMEIFQKGGLAFMVDRVKEILISNSNDTYKVSLIRKLFGAEEEVKIEDNQENYSVDTFNKVKLSSK